MITEKHHETLTEFQSNIDAAKMNGDEWVETTPEIIKYYNRNGLGKHAKYFIFHNIKVCERGQLQAIQSEMDRQLGKINFGDDEATVNQVKTTRNGIVEV